MKAIRIETTGGPEVMKLVEINPPRPGLRDLLVKQAACGVNFIDTYHRSGLYKVPLPSGIGQEAAGIVEAVGAEVTRHKPGDRVAYASAREGAYAELHVVHEDRAARLPQAISFETAAAVMLKGMTTRYLLRKTFRVERGHVIVIYAAAGGVGQLVVQWAKHLGATVIAIVGSDAKAEIVRALGADHVILHGRDDIAQSVRAITNGIGADVVYDSVGKDTFNVSLDCLRTRGMMVTFGNASGPPPDVSPMTLLAKGGLFLTRPMLLHYTGTAPELDETAADLFAMLENGAVKLAPPTLYKLAEAADAHRDLASRKTTGSLVLIP